MEQDLFVWPILPNGSIEKDVKMLDKFFLCNQKETVQKLVAFDRKYKEYQTFIKCKMRLNA